MLRQCLDSWRVAAENQSAFIRIYVFLKLCSTTLGFVNTGDYFLPTNFCPFTPESAEVMLPVLWLQDELVPEQL